MKAFNGISAEHTVHFSESALARTQIIVRTKPGNVPDFDVREIEEEIVKTARRWQDNLHDALVAHFGEERGNQLPPALRERFSRWLPGGVFNCRSGHRRGHHGRPQRREEMTMNLYQGDAMSDGSVAFESFPVWANRCLSRPACRCSNIWVPRCLKNLTTKWSPREWRRCMSTILA